MSNEIQNVGLQKDGRFYLDEKRHAVALRIIRKVKAKEREEMVDGFMRNFPQGKDVRPKFTNLPNTNPFGRRYSLINGSFVVDPNGDYYEEFIRV